MKIIKQNLVWLACLSIFFVNLFVKSAYADNTDVIIISPSLTRDVMILAVSKESRVKLRLPTNMGTGYDWLSLNSKVKSSLLKSNKEIFVGNTEIREFIIPELKKESEYLFIYKRIWEEKSKNEKKFKLILKLI